LIDPVVFVGDIVCPECGAPAAVIGLQAGAQVEQGVRVDFELRILPEAVVGGALIVEVGAEEGGEAGGQAPLDRFDAPQVGFCATRGRIDTEVKNQ
jgi:hypothetical protein